MTITRFWLPVLLLYSVQPAYCQISPSFGSEWSSARYLADKDAVDEVRHIDPKRLTTPQRNWLVYGAKSLDSAS